MDIDSQWLRGLGEDGLMAGLGYGGQLSLDIPVPDEAPWPRPDAASRTTPLAGLLR